MDSPVFLNPLTLMIVPFVKSSFDALLKLQEVMRFRKLSTPFADTQAELPGGEAQARFRYDTAGSDLRGGGWARSTL